MMRDSGENRFKSLTDVSRRATPSPVQIITATATPTTQACQVVSQVTSLSAQPGPGAVAACDPVCACDPGGAPHAGTGKRCNSDGRNKNRIGSVSMQPMAEYSPN